MSLLNALFNGGTGIRANQIWADYTSRNISNANTEGYVRKTVHFSTSAEAVGGGVYVSEVVREVNHSLDKMFRYESAKLEYEEAIYTGIESYTAALGQPNDEKSPAFKLADFKAQLVTLINTPSSSAVQQGVVMSAEALAKSLRDTATTLQSLRDDNTLQIKYEVADLNEALQRIADLNNHIARRHGINEPINELHDEITRVVDQIAQQVNIRTVYDEIGRMSIYTGGGAPLVEGNRIQEITWNQANNKLYAGQMEITPADPTVRGFEYGRIAGLFEVRNTIIPQFSNQLDAMAQGLIEQFELNDTSLAPGQAGLFTDNGNPLDLSQIEGLALRIKVNDAVIAERGGAAWRIRDGIGAVTSGPASDTEQITRFLEGFKNGVNNDPLLTGMTTGLTLEVYSANMVAHQQNVRAKAEISYANIRVSTETIEVSRLSVQGVNIDDELQRLLVIEQSFAANTQVIKTVTSMLDALLTLGN